MTLTGLSPLAYFASRLSSETFHDMRDCQVLHLSLFVTIVFITGLILMKRNASDQDSQSNPLDSQRNIRDECLYWSFSFNCAVGIDLNERRPG